MEEPTEAILNASGGTPCVMNRLCSQSLLCASTRKLDLVDADTAMQAINDCELCSNNVTGNLYRVPFRRK
ncbi:MAG: hypothetical protein K1W34_19005 [Lachnospiraceae bacterium]